MSIQKCDTFLFLMCNFWLFTCIDFSSIWINSIHLQISKAQFMFSLNSAIRRKQFMCHIHSEHNFSTWNEQNKCYHNNCPVKESGLSVSQQKKHVFKKMRISRSMNESTVCGKKRKFYGRNSWICNGDFMQENSTAWKKTKIRKTRQQIHQGTLLLMDSAFGLKLIYSAKKTHHDMQGIFESDCESNQKISLYY